MDNRIKSQSLVSRRSCPLAPNCHSSAALSALRCTTSDFKVKVSFIHPGLINGMAALQKTYGRPHSNGGCLLDHMGLPSASKWGSLVTVTSRALLAWEKVG